MGGINLPELAILTLRDPREAAAQVLKLGLPQPIVVAGLVLAAALNAIAFSISIRQVTDLPAMPVIFTNPFLFFVMMVVLLAGSAVVMFNVAQSFGGKGSVLDLLTLMVWLQMLRAVAQGALIVVSAVANGMAMLFGLMIGFWGLWVLANFVAAGTKLETAFHGLAVIVLSGVAMILIMVVLLMVAQMLGMVPSLEV